MRSHQLTIDAFYGPRGIKEGIQLTLRAGHLSATVTLVYSAIDAVAALCRSAEAQQTSRKDFVDWCERYLHVPAPVRLTGLDWYAARCGVLHTYSAESVLSRKGSVRLIGYRGGGTAPGWVKEVDNGFVDSLVMVQVEQLAEAFFRGLDDCLPSLYETPARAELTESRLQGLFSYIPYKEIEAMGEPGSGR